MGPITAILPVPRTISIGGEPVTVSELRLRDIATLQAILEGEWADPLAAIEDALPAERKPRNRMLAKAYLAAEVGPPVYGTARGHEFFGAPTGAALLLWVAGRETPGLTPEKSAKLYMLATPGELARAWRVAHGVPTLKAIEGLLWARPPGAGGDGASVTWAEMIDEIARERNWTYQQIYDLTITEWMAARNHGKRPDSDRRILTKEDQEAAMEQAATWAEAMEGDDEDAGND